MGRYELVGFDENKKGKVIKTKNSKKLTILEADEFTTLFNNSHELSYYLYKKDYLDDFIPLEYCLLYKHNKMNRFIECLYSDSREIVLLGQNLNGMSKDFVYLLSYLIKNINTMFPEYAHESKYINDYIYNKILEYRALYKKENFKELNRIIYQIKRELLKEYLQIRKLYTFIRKNKKETNIKLSVKVIGSTDDSFINYLIESANNGNFESYEELKNMDLEKTLNLRM